MRLRTLLLAALVGAPLLATNIDVTNTPVTDTGWTACDVNAAYSCRTTAYFNTAESLYSQGNYNPLVGNNFQTEFDAWNTGSTWTLEAGAPPPTDLTFTLTVANALQFDNNGDPGLPAFYGGLTITIAVSGTLPTLDAGYQYVWLQGLYDNYQIPFQIVPPYYEMDINSAGCVTAGTGAGGDRSGDVMCPPAYPYQDQDGVNSFYDRPKARYVVPPSTPQVFFDATTMFGEIDYATSDVKVYDGLTYGFQNFVTPEPTSWLIAACGALALALLKRRSKA